MHVKRQTSAAEHGALNQKSCGWGLESVQHAHASIGVSKSSQEYSTVHPTADTRTTNGAARAASQRNDHHAADNDVDDNVGRALLHINTVSLTQYTHTALDFPVSNFPRFALFWIQLMNGDVCRPVRVLTPQMEEGNQIHEWSVRLNRVWNDRCLLLNIIKVHKQELRQY